MLQTTNRETDHPKLRHSISSYDLLCSAFGILVVVTTEELPGMTGARGHLDAAKCSQPFMFGCVVFFGLISTPVEVGESVLAGFHLLA